MDLKTLLAKPPHSLSLSLLLGFIRMPRFVLFRPVLSHPIDRLLSLVTFYEKSNIGDSWITCKVVFPGLMRDILMPRTQVGVVSSPTNLEIPFRCVTTGHLWIVPN